MRALVRRVLSAGIGSGRDRARQRVDAWQAFPAVTCVRVGTASVPPHSGESEPVSSRKVRAPGLVDPRWPPLCADPARVSGRQGGGAAPGWGPGIRPVVRGGGAGRPGPPRSLLRRSLSARAPAAGRGGVATAASLHPR